MWICKKCNEEQEDSFDACWKCGCFSEEKKDEVPKFESEEKNPHYDIRLQGILQELEDEVLTDDEIKTASHTKRFLNNFIDSIILIIIYIGPAFILGPIGIILGWIFVICYYPIFEIITGRTIGKYITGTKVITVNGGKPTFFNVILRTLCRLIPFEPFSFLGTNAIGLHDMLSGTLVVDADFRKEDNS